MSAFSLVLAAFWLRSQPNPLPNGYVAVSLSSDLSYVAAVRDTGGEFAIFKCSATASSEVARARRVDGGLVSGVNQLIVSGKRMLLVLDSVLYLVNIERTAPHISPKGAVAILPKRMDKKWIGSYYDESFKRLIYVFDADSFREAEMPASIRSISVCNDLPLYTLDLGRTTNLLLADHAPTIVQSRFLFGTTRAFFTAQKPRILSKTMTLVGNVVGSSNLYIIRQKLVGKDLCDILLCSLTRKRVRQITVLIKGANWPGEDFDEVHFVGGNSLLYLYGGSVTRSLVLYDQDSVRVRRISNDVQPASPMMGHGMVYGRLFEPSVSAPGAHRKSTSAMMYRLRKSGFSIGKLTKPWVNVIDCGRNLFVGQRVINGATVSFFLTNFPALRNGKWIITSTTEMPIKQAQSR